MVQKHFLAFILVENFINRNMFWLKISGENVFGRKFILMSPGQDFFHKNFYLTFFISKCLSSYIFSVENFLVENFCTHFLEKDLDEKIIYTIFLVKKIFGQIFFFGENFMIENCFVKKNL